MNYLSGFHRIISVMLIFILLIELTGCHSPKMLSANELILEESYIVHAGRNIYRTYGISMKDSIVYGNINFKKPVRGEEAFAHIYLTSDSVVELRNEKINFPGSSIEEIKRFADNKENRSKRVSWLVVGGVLGAAVVTVLLVTEIRYWSFLW